MSRPIDIPESAWRAGLKEAQHFAQWLHAGNSAGALSEHAILGLADSIARALIAAEQRGRNEERQIWQPAIEYFDRYCVDEAECTSICIDDDQHDRAKAFAAVVSRAKAEAVK